YGEGQLDTPPRSTPNHEHRDRGRGPGDRHRASEADRVVHRGLGLSPSGRGEAGRCEGHHGKPYPYHHDRPKAGRQTSSAALMEIQHDGLGPGRSNCPNCLVDDPGPAGSICEWEEPAGKRRSSKAAAERIREIAEEESGRLSALAGGSWPVNGHTDAT